MPHRSTVNNSHVLTLISTSSQSLNDAFFPPVNDDKSAIPPTNLPMLPKGLVFCCYIDAVESIAARGFDMPKPPIIDGIFLGALVFASISGAEFRRPCSAKLIVFLLL